jgi:hypothetical protein
MHFHFENANPFPRIMQLSCPLLQHIIGKLVSIPKNCMMFVHGQSIYRQMTIIPRCVKPMLSPLWPCKSPLVHFLLFPSHQVCLGIVAFVCQQYLPTSITWNQCYQNRRYRTVFGWYRPVPAKNTEPASSARHSYDALKGVDFQFF